MTPRQNDEPGSGQRKAGWLPLLAWGVALGLVCLAAFLGWRWFSGRPVALHGGESGVKQNPVSISQELSVPVDRQIDVPAFEVVEAVPIIYRQSDLHTIMPDQPVEEIRQYTVEKGDSVFEIAARFDLKPESVLWANYDQLNDNPDMIELGMQLNIPPANGVLYQWNEGDTIESVAGRFQAKPEDILSWSGNNIDLTNPQVEPGALILVPDGKREYRQWIIPTIPRGRAGVSQSLYGSGACQGSYDGAYGSGAFVWPAANHVLSGNDYWDGHLGIDVAAGEGAQIYAADSGVVVFAGWALGGYGNMVMIDHGNGYQTVYAHMSSVSVNCGQSVRQGGIIGYSGSTGNSTGPHLHFEVRYLGGFVNPWYVLPAP